MGTATGEAPDVVSFTRIIPATATGATFEVPVIKAPFTGTVSSVTYTPAAAITGANTNTRKVSVINKGAAGSGTTEAAGLQFDSAVNGVAFDEKTVTLSVTTANLDVVAGDILSFKSAAVGTGLADPGGLLIVELSRD